MFPTISFFKSNQNKRDIRFVFVVYHILRPVKSVLFAILVTQICLYYNRIYFHRFQIQKYSVMLNHPVSEHLP